MEAFEAAVVVFPGATSGVLFALVAFWILVQSPTTPTARTFAWLLLSWGVATVLSNAAASAGTIPLALLAESAALILPLVVTTLALSLAGEFSPWAARVRFAALFSTLAGAGLLAASPRSFIASSSNDASLVTGSGPLALLFGQLGFYLALGVSSLILLDAARRATERARSRELALVGSAFACFLGAATAWFGLRTFAALPAYAATRSAADVAIVVFLFATSTLFLALIAWRTARASMPREDKRLVLLALGVPFGTSLLAAGVLLAGGPRVNPVGFWRTVTVALLVLAIMRHRLLGGELRFRRSAIATLTVFFALGVALLAEGVARAFGVSALADPGAALAVGVVFALGVVVPHLPVSHRLARRAFRALVEPHDPSRAQDFEVYRAALEARAARGDPIEPTVPALAQLRDRLRIELRDHELLAMFVARRGARSVPVFAPGERILDGTLTVEREIGAGASARVYEARDEAGRAVAVKVQAPLLQQDAATGARAVREARMLDGIQSANVLRVVEVADRPEAFYVVTERAQGTLADRIASGPLPVDEALRVTGDVLSGLAAAHKAGIVHRDVKPANVLLSEGRAVLADFDAAGSADERATRGTPAWMAPEQFSGERVGPSADVHAVGALLFRMLAGRHYVRVDGLGGDAIRLLVERAEPSIPEAWPPDVRAFVGRCLAKDPAARFADASDALAALPTRGREGATSRRR